MTDTISLENTEEATVFSVEGESVIGILHNGSTTQSTGVLLVVGGRQYRVGAHRQFVSLARHLSASGYPVFRFDMRGMGDSSAAPVHFLDTGPDIAAALEEFRRAAPKVKRILLWGLCDGASAALFSALGHADVDGVMIVNPWISTDSGQARTRLKHYYQKQLVSASFWKKLISGGVNWVDAASSLGSEFRHILIGARSDPDLEYSLPDKVFKAMDAFKGTITVVISEKDLTAKEFKDEYDRRYTGSSDAISCWKVISVDSDHTFSTPETQARLEDLTEQWVKTNQIR